MKLAGAILLVIAAGLFAGWVIQRLGFKAIPSVHDEFGYLLEADTFLHGRLTNPTPPKPEYFQTFHELLRPTYMAKFPPGQGLALAVGSLFGSTILGAYGTIALACGAIAWTIRAWLPTRWALFGGLLAAGHPLMRIWSHVYWGGGVALLGGALLTGAILRAARQPRRRHALVAAAGLSILLISRPLEGTIYATLCGVYLLAIGRWQRRPIAWKFLVAGFLGMLPILVFIGYDNWRVTGSLTQFPYSLYASQFQRPPLLFGGGLNEHVVDVDDRFKAWRDGFELSEYLGQSTPAGYLTGVRNKLRDIAGFWIQPIGIALLLVPLPWLLRWRRYRWLLALTIGLPIVLMIITPWMRMHYLAPAGAAYFLLLSGSARQLSRWRIGAVASIVVLVWTSYSGFAFVYAQSQVDKPLGWSRAAMMDRLSRLPGKQVVIVHYTTGPQDIFEWVFNDADIQAEQVAWARDLGPQTVKDLQTIFPDRTFWRLEVAEHDLKLNPIAPPKTADFVR